MKCVLVVFIALIALVAGDEEWTPVRTDEEMQVLHDDCVKGIALTKKQLEMIDNIKYPNEKEVRDYVLCLVKRMNLFTEQGGFDSNRLMGQIDAMDAICYPLRREKKSKNVRIALWTILMLLNGLMVT